MSRRTPPKPRTAKQIVESLTSQVPRVGRPPKGLVPVTLKLTPEQHQVLVQTALRARLDGKPNAAEGASFLARRLVQAWIDRGAKWPVE